MLFPRYERIKHAKTRGFPFIFCWSIKISLKLLLGGQIHSIFKAYHMAMGPSNSMPTKVQMLYIFLYIQYKS